MVRWLDCGVAVTGERFWGARARPRGPALVFVASSADRARTPGVLRAVGTDEAVHVTGGLSAGSLGWTLAAEVVRHRWTLSLYVTARQLSCHRGPAGIEDFDYDARVSGLTAGRYRLRVVHIYADTEGEPLGEPLTVLEQPLVVGKPAIASMLRTVCWLGGLWATTIVG